MYFVLVSDGKSIEIKIAIIAVTIISSSNVKEFFNISHSRILWLSPRYLHKHYKSSGADNETFFKIPIFSYCEKMFNSLLLSLKLLQKTFRIITYLTGKTISAQTGL